MANSLLLLHVHVEVADHHNAARRPDALLATRELTGGHVAFEDVHAVLLIEQNARHLIEAHQVVETHKSSLAAGHVYEHLRDRRLTARYQVRVRRNLLVQVAPSARLSAAFSAFLAGGAVASVSVVATF